MLTCVQIKYTILVIFVEITVEEGVSLSCDCVGILPSFSKLKDPVPFSRACLPHGHPSCDGMRLHLQQGYLEL